MYELYLSQVFVGKSLAVSRDHARVPAREVHVVNLLQHFLRQRDIIGVERVNVLPQLRYGRRADDGARDVPSRAAPCQRQRGKRDACLLRDGFILFCRRLRGHVEVPLHE